MLNAIRNNTIASEPDFRIRLLEAIQNNEPLKDSLVGTQLLKDPTTKIFYDKFQLKISPKKVLEILENRLKKSIETTNEALNAFNAPDSQAIDLNAISNSVGLNPTQESKITDNSVELNNAQEQTAQEQDTQETAPTTLKQETQEQETPTAPAIPLNPKMDFKPSEEALIKGAKTRYKANIKAIGLLKELQAKQEILKGDYYATLKEQEILAQFSGWGGLDSYFKKDQHPEEFKELNALLTKDEFRRAYLSVRDAYYTPKLVIDSIYQALDQLGFNNDNHQKEIFEPSLGTGKFIAHAPSDKNYRFMGTELDPISANISKLLYPNQVIQNTALENHQFYQDYDAFVGNPPYGDHKIYSFYDKELSNESVHNYFLGKAIKELKDDGIGAFVVSSWFMDAKNPKMREHIAKNATKTDAIIIDANNERYQEVQKLIKNLERGELVKWDNLYCQLEQNNERGIFLKPTKINSKVQDSRLKAYFKIKEALNDLTSAELNLLSSDLEIESKRAKLNLVYDGFVKKFGYLNENKNRKDIKQDLYGAKVLGLEKDFEKEITPKSTKMQNIEPRQAQAKKAQIFFERTLNPKKELIITNAKEALIASINQKGGLDLHFIRDHFT
ncbi:Eco57I restriction-modification methylase domain-containing protein, partial [Helicobacter pylori]